MNESSNLIALLMDLPVFQAEWVLYLLILLSLASVAIMVERIVFYRRHRIDVENVRSSLSDHLDKGDYEGAAKYLQRFDSLETNTVLFGLRDCDKGPDSVQDLVASAARKEKARYEQRLSFLATVASNAPFIGLFGTVLGIIRAFKDLSANMSEASSAVMAGIAEALIATAVGLLVAIPAVVAFNIFKGKVKAIADDGNVLVATLLARLKAGDL
ncbi:MAG: MotA/TolQ/ExbB proton channel family protein [Gammaproteobacteria bacterium]|nr:MAG: MotA/TolQ/ExbB proton channel family protein [Gammaproteobacteria bacterium]